MNFPWYELGFGTRVRKEFPASHLGLFGLVLKDFPGLLQGLPDRLSPDVVGGEDLRLHLGGVGVLR